MATLTISLPEQQLQALLALSQRFKIAPEELVRMSIEDLTTRPEADFQKALEYVLTKNVALYQQLA